MIFGAFTASDMCEVEILPVLSGGLAWADKWQIMGLSCKAKSRNEQDRSREPLHISLWMKHRLSFTHTHHNKQERLKEPRMPS